MQKNNTVTYVKAIGIILMVIAHALSPETIAWRIIYTFHMPLFFIMSGYCFKNSYLNSPKQFLIKKIKGIYLPFVFYSLPFLFLHNLFCSIYIYDHNWTYSWRDFLWNTSRIVTRMSHNEGLLGTFWFLKELFWGNLIFFCAIKCFNLRPAHLSLFLFILTEVLCITHLRIPYFNVTYNSFFSAFFISIGYCWKNNNWHLKWWMIILSPIAIAIELVIKHSVSFNDLSPTGLILFAIPALGGTLIVFELCRVIAPRMKGFAEKTLNFIGNHTLPIMALHFLSFRLVSYVFIRVYSLPIDRLSEHPILHNYPSRGIWIIYTFAGIFIPMMLSLLMEKIKQTIQKKKTKRDLLVIN